MMAELAPVDELRAMFARCQDGKRCKLGDEDKTRILAIVGELESRSSELHELRMLAYEHGYVGVTLGDEESRSVSVLEWLRFRLQAYDRMVTRLVAQNSKDTTNG